MRHAVGLRAWSSSFALAALALGLAACAEPEASLSLDADGDYHDTVEPAAPTPPALHALTTTLPATIPSPACFVSGNALYVVEDAGNLPAGDGAALARLRELGLSVTVRSDEQLVAGDANGKQLIVISSTVGSTVVGPIFRNTAVPIVTWEHALYDELGMTGSGSNDNGSTGGQSKIAMIAGIHPLTVGLSGVVRILSGTGIVRWGNASGGAHALAHFVGDSSKDPLLYIERGASLVGGGTAPARRVGLFLDDGSAQDATPAAWLLFDAAVVWALGDGTLAARAWLVTGATDLTDADAALRDRLRSVGFTVDVVRQDALAATRLTGVALVVIAESVDSATVGHFFDDLPVPVVMTEDNMTDLMGLASSHGRASSQTNVTISSASSPLAAGLSGDVRVYSNASEIMWAEPNGNATVVARSKSSPTHPAIFGYETGASMVGRTAPARRLSLFHYRGNNLTTQGGALFDAGVSWAGISRALDVCPGEASSCQRFELGAARTYNPSSVLDDVRTLGAPFTFWIPPTVPVSQGNSGNGHVTLSFGDSASGNLVRCRYVGSGTEANPSTPDGIARADRYDFDTAEDGNCSGLVPGNVVSAAYFKLHIDESGNSNASNGRTEVRLGLAGPTATSDATCNAVDEDCDGRVDEDYPTSPTTCGVGACAASGSRTCVGGAVVNTCTPGTPAASDTTCNGVDDNCNGTRDEGYVPVATTCGVGACLATGTTSCVAGGVQNSCTPGTPAASDTTCNGVDDNCNGTRDEGYVPVAITCGVGACVRSGSTACVAGGVQNVCTPGTPAASDTTCNGIDDNCNGTRDEGYVPSTTTCGVGACVAVGTTSCVAGGVQDSCHPGTPAPADTTCNGIDDNCNGTRDEGYVPVATTCGVGACRATGVTSCVAGGVQNSCTPGTPTSTSDNNCNGIDDDCDGLVDEDYAPTATTCGVGACGATGATSCVAGHVVDSCHAGTPAVTDATCNGIDDNCNGAVDEQYAPTATTCGVGACGATGATSCVAGHVVDSCHAGTPAATDATCNGIDDNCNGAVDEQYAPTATSCGVGACAATGATSCVAGHVVDSCHAGTPAASDTSCNNIDDDCDGHVDEDFVTLPTTCGVGACADVGHLRCVLGHVLDTCRPGNPASSDASCDGIDNNCNGQTDEQYVPTATSCGVGACSATGATSCVAGHVGDSCRPGTPAATDATCNGIDDNCNGAVDEQYAPTATSCGVGACAATGATTCVAGHVVDSCHAGTPGASDTTCDGRDDNCNGVADEGFVPTPTTCGVGACGATGTTTCTNGHVGDSCQPGSPSGSAQTIFGEAVPANPAFADSGVELGVKWRSARPGFVRAIRFYRGVRNPQGYVVSLWDASGHLLATASLDGQAQPVPGWQVATLPVPVAVAADTTYVASYYTSAGGYGAEHFGFAGAITSGDLTGLADGADGGNGVYAYGGASSFPNQTFLASNYFVDVAFTRGLAAGSDTSCNGVDDDCDGSVDEDYVAIPTACGVGVCAAAGETRCTNGSVGSTCVPGAPTSPIDSLCNGLDDDCDGQIDEEVVSLPVSCGVGACSATGHTTCTAGVPANDCVPSTPGPADTTCNGIDENCSGASDEGYVSHATSCGVGACVAIGATSCVGGSERDSCTPGAPAPSDTTCDAIDDNCNGSVDEGFASAPTSCGVGACAATGSTSCIAGSVVDSCHPGTPAASDATCNNVDENCNGTADEGYVSTPTSCGVGVCRNSGSTSCVAGGVVDSCRPRPPTSGVDITCNGLDENCNGSVDEGYLSHPTSCGVGACAAAGVTTCSGGSVHDSCVPRPPTSTTDTTCNGVDENCNGRTDENYASVTTSCGLGVCSSTGVTSCVAGGVVDSCRPGTPTSTTDNNCNGLDDDCDGQIDEDYAPHATTCGVGACAANGVTACVAGHVVDSCTPAAPTTTVDTTCNGIDDNCNGRVDESYAPVATSCGVGACAATGATSCVAGHVVDSCHAGTGAPSDTTCNGIDDDCDGATDEDYAPTPTACGIGACTATGRVLCVGGVATSDCHPSTPAANDALCNGVDDDCDGQIDEDFVAAPTSCGVGACHASGATTCVAGHPGDSCHAGTGAPSDASCNGIDDDCDGSVDEDYAPRPTTCGVGACSATGRLRCIGGAEQNDCHPNAPALDDSLCNGVDDDCDGSVDEEYHPTATSCGVGACRAAGVTSCVSGVVADSCHAGTPAPTDTSCNGIDDNCNGAVDEGYVSTPTSCGIGACRRSGATSCSAGHVADSCHAGAPAPSDATCDGVDDNCNGTADEGYAPTPTVCGIGACTATGRLTCTFGVPTNDCHPTAPAPNDALCNGIDDDCDGPVDEEYVAHPTSCGVGACAATGATSCVGGAVADSCHAGTPAPTDASCNGIDDNCNGSVDEGYLPTPTSCGVGACRRSGQRVCASGHESNTCAPGAPAPADRTCDSIDDDCDGSADEDYLPVTTACGVGACTSIGVTSCAGGHVGDSCHPGTPATTEACDGIDNDCDGATDEPDGTLRWSKVNRIGPSPRWGAAIASDDAHGRLILEGGRAEDGLSAETWGWNGVNWSLLASLGPPRRIDHAMVYDADRDRVVLFGGVVDNHVDGETWEWNGGTATWTRVAVGGPSPRYAHAMAYDATRHVTVLFGGVDAAGTLLSDTWVWDGVAHTWTLLATGGPSGRKGHVMGYDPIARTVSLVGGYDGVVKGDRWEWDGLVWTSSTTSLLGPREEHTLVYDEARARFVAFGGIGAFSSLLGDTRALVGGMWTFLLSSGPSARFLHAMGWDPVNDATLVFGGADLDGHTFGDTWLLGEQCYPQ